MKEGLIASSYEFPKCNDQHNVTWSAIKTFFKIVPATPNVCSTITSQNKYGGVHTIIRLAMRPLRLFLKSVVTLSPLLGRDQKDIAIAVQSTGNAYWKGSPGKSNTTPNYDIGCRLNVVLHSKIVQQPIHGVSPNSTIVLLRIDVSFINKHNVVPFRYPFPPFIAPLAALTSVVSSQGKRKQCMPCGFYTARSAGKMEVCGMQKTFLRSEQKHGLKYQRYIGDGDSKTFLSIAEKEPYGDSVPIVKIECGGHV
ncbi:hypothetical protein TNCV_1112081 [Trichonephila clavipes]|uniref:Mutator-like transposase domain-containing protein n=1 Tax=Trichonephila clavipes TaxID=2585209 RepID=A0A8X6UTS2_TRICX|nr:hypothetical protein TNCV_1112081 [Trichonephila clavipes]